MFEPEVIYPIKQPKVELYHEEVWKDIKGYEGMYQVSSYGRVKSVNREISQQKDGTYFSRKMKSRILKTQIINSGYELVNLSKNGIRDARTVHRLVAEAFVQKENGRDDVNHIDGNKTNNLVDNIEWVSRSENVQHSYDHLTRKSKGKNVKCIDTGEVFRSVAEAARKKKLSRVAISHSLNGRSESSGGCKWEYV